MLAELQLLLGAAALREICKGVREDAQQVCRELITRADDVAARIASMQAERARRDQNASRHPSKGPPAEIPNASSRSVRFIHIPTEEYLQSANT